MKFKDFRATYRTMQHARIRAVEIKRSLGTRSAAGYLRNQGISLEGAVAILAINKAMQTNVRSN